MWVCVGPCESVAKLLLIPIRRGGKLPQQRPSDPIQALDRQPAADIAGILIVAPRFGQPPVTRSPKRNKGRIIVEGADQGNTDTQSFTIDVVPGLLGLNGITLVGGGEVRG